MTSSETLNKDKNVILSVGKGAIKGASVGVSFFKDFLNFINKGNVIDLATGVVIGGAFTKIVDSIVGDLFSPIIGLATGSVNLSENFITICNKDSCKGQKYNTREEAAKGGAVTFNWGNFVQTLINFIIIGLCVYFVVKLVGLVWRKQEEISTDWPCPRCKAMNKLGATRCFSCHEDPICPENVDLELYKKDPEAAMKKEN
ncbi:MscL-domain-containing protein [Anaeromyces robustus]|uniref:MscL-domain-containing protein n=1 Tax=Anaeromyces robustus TaxID=1754192 RepID=A0A1Y1X851_9FUNG|nr:MscL-domain-containing protein [Anaeromyces robustus]|eukprot:ORX81888.1 MscL-domain-containing protein [Anaeromyces robustus]